MKYEKAPAESFEKKKTDFFSEISLSVLSAMRVHKKEGNLWERDREGRRSWGNVSEHCLVEVARFRVLAEKLGLPAETKRAGELGAALHDFDKRLEKMAMEKSIAAGGSGREASNARDKEGERQLRDAGFDDAVIQLAGCVGGKPEQLFEIVHILEKNELSNQEIGILALHYIDGYTRNSEWVKPAEKRGDGSIVNEVDRRTEKNLDNPTYRKQDQEYVASFEGSPLLQGRGPIENERIVCHEIEKRLSAIIASRTNEEVEPLRLPEVIDAEIWKAIEEKDS